EEALDARSLRRQPFRAAALGSRAARSWPARRCRGDARRAARGHRARRSEAARTLSAAPGAGATRRPRRLARRCAAGGCARPDRPSPRRVSSPIEITREFIAANAARFDDALEIAKNEFRLLDSDAQYTNAFARLLKWDPLERVA